jgi:hypothetical protein
MSGSWIRVARAALAVMAAVACSALGGCDGRPTASVRNLQTLAGCVSEYREKYSTLPDSLDQLREFFASEDEYQQTLKNPLTGDDPGYLYVRPPVGVIGSSLADRVVMLYQLRSGEKAEDLPVGYAGGSTGDIRDTSISRVTPAWRDCPLREAGLSAAFPGEPTRVTGDSGRVTWTANFCGLQYTVVFSPGSRSRRASHDDPQPILQALRDGVVRQLNGRLVDSRPVTWSGHPGLAATIDVPDADNEVQVRWFFVEDRLYCLLVSGPKGSLADENAGRFLGSCKLAGP